MNSNQELDEELMEAPCPEAPRTGAGSLSPEQIAEYDREGYLVLPRLLSPEDLAPARAALMQKVDEIAEGLVAGGLIKDERENDPFETRLVNLFRGLTEADFLHYGRSWRDRYSGYYRLISNPKILDAVEALIGSEIYANPVYNARPKVPGVAAGAVPWHQDKSYWPNANWNPVITVWIPLVDTNELNGCLHVWPRTHMTRLVSFHKETDSGTGYTEIDLKDKADRNAVALPVEAGSAILFNDRCIHSSTPNCSVQVRWSVDLRDQPTDQERMAEYGVGYPGPEPEIARARDHAGGLAGAAGRTSGLINARRFYRAGEE